MVDQVFSRISARLAKVNCYTLETFVAVVAEAYTPAPRVEPLSETIDFQAWLSPFFYKDVTGITEPHQFLISRSEDLKTFPTGTCIRASKYSNTPLKDPFSILKSLPTGIPFVKAGRPLFHRHGGTDDKFAADYEAFRKQILNIKMYEHQRESWNNLLSNIEVMQSAPAKEYACWWPESKQEVRELFEAFQRQLSEEGKDQRLLVIFGDSFFKSPS